MPGFAGLRESGGSLAFSPRLPAGLTRLCSTVGVRGSRLRLTVTPAKTTYDVLEGGPVSLRHAGLPVSVSVGTPVTVPNRAPEVGEAPTQPRHRPPLRHREGAT